MDEQNETYEEQFQRFYDKYKNRRAAATKLHDAFTEYFECLLELPELRRGALESIASSLEPEWKDFPELQDQSEKSVRNVERFSTKLLNHLGDTAEESVSSCEEEIAEKESLFEKMTKVKQDIRVCYRK
ncbi:hypothetical protein CDAR_396851 [Caerostris darwini]|uniref:Uncharacterized protein n=1 Tax=Caerostris darwini TaxID=1538125 RepID=A0AAV4WN52_9ARAC|nr:hypothetical protein CDAR_396851 [Caerostris darwini]